MCREFLAPKHIDPKFLDPRHVFKELTTNVTGDADKSIVNNAHTSVFQPEKKKRHRDGYAEGDYTLFKKAGAGEFVRSLDPVTFLGSVNRISFDTEEEKESVFSEMRALSVLITAADGFLWTSLLQISRQIATI